MHSRRAAASFANRFPSRREPTVGTPSATHHTEAMANNDQ
jgi:hypothetical protein